MALVKIDGGWFDPESHGYYGLDGKFVPSVTQVLKLTGLSNYDFVNPEVLKAKAELGTEVHGLTVLKDQMGDLDPTWIGERAVPYFAAYEQFVHEKHFVPDPEWTERSVIATIYGMKVGVTPDRFGKLAKTDTVIELKCVDRLTNEHLAQCLNYLRASGMSLCLLVNFQRPTVEWKRVVLHP